MPVSVIMRPDEASHEELHVEPPLLNTGPVEVSCGLTSRAVTWG